MAFNEDVYCTLVMSDDYLPGTGKTTSCTSLAPLTMNRRRRTRTFPPRLWYYEETRRSRHARHIATQHT
jgi:hypothetical protein